MFISYEQSQALKLQKETPKADLLFSETIQTQFDDWFTVRNEKSMILQNKKFIEDVFSGLLGGSQDIDPKTQIQIFELLHERYISIQISEILEAITSPRQL